ncbi:MAG: LLM class flavin-dependent oxidoreductase [Xanthobacteraceae bacterium]|jgi:alkanesulfonate monooxygenase SsuD/methylene tetrahydromethanopterin reductase-like flavin-dependent oxidoreductase (luciferase family)
MDARSRADQLREASNPLFNDRKLKLGTFCSNLSGGATMSSIDGVLQAKWESSLTLARLADEMEFEAIVPVGRWKGFGGATNFNGEGFECFTWAAAMSALTKNCGVFATSHVPTMHPVMAAKQAATIDHIGGGRFTLNVVTGWYRPEIEMFGAPLLEHDTRYDMAVEWLEIIKRLWTSEEEFDFDGKFYQVKRAIMAPKPVQKPHPAIMSAGASPKGRQFAARHADVNFINLDAHDFEAVKARVDASRKTAWDECKREIQVWTNAYIFQGDTEADACAFYEDCVFKNGDWEGVENLVNIMGLNSLSIPAPALQTLKQHFIGGWAGYPLIGTKDQVVDGLALLERAGFDGIVLSWPRYIEDMRQFKAETFPLVQQAGLR